MRGNYKPCKLSHTHLHPAKKSSQPPTPTHTKPKKVTLTHAHSHPVKKKITPPKKVTPIHTHPHPAKEGNTHPHLPTCSQKKVIPTYTSCKSMEKKIIHKLIKFIRNSRSLKYNFCKVTMLGNWHFNFNMVLDKWQTIQLLS